MKLKIPQVYSQRDPKWGSKLLGYNTGAGETIGNYGCLITCLACYINNPPNVVNDLLVQNNGYVAGSGLFVWSKSTVLGLNQTYLSPDYTGIPVTSQGMTKLTSLLDAGYPVLCEIDFYPETANVDMHFVLAYGYEGENVFVIDPWTGTQISLDVYGGAKRAIIQFRAYDRSLPIDTGKPTVAVDPAIFENLVRKSTIYDKIIEKLHCTDSETVVLTNIDSFLKYEDEIRTKDEDNKKAKEQIVTLENTITELQNKQKQLTDDNTAYVKRLDIQDNQLKDVLGELQTLKTQVSKPPYTGIKKFLLDIINALP